MLQKQSLFLIVALLYFSPVTMAQRCNLSLSGHVIDRHDSSPLEFSTVYLLETQTGAVADISGKYAIDGLCPGIYHIVCSHIGCLPDTFALNIQEDMKRVFTLEHHAEELYAIEIKAMQQQEVQTQAVGSMDERIMDNHAGQNLGEMLSELPGVNMLQSGPTIAKPVLHGMTGNRLLILNNNVRQEGQQWGAEHAPAIDPFSAQKLTVVKGAAAVKYGSDAIGGVVLVEPNELPTTPGVNGKIGASAASNGRQAATSGMLEGGIKKIAGLGWRVQGTLKRAGDHRSADYMLTNTGIEESNFSAAAGYNKDRFGVQAYYSYFGTELGILRSAHIGNLTDLKAAIGSQQPRIVEPFSYDIDNPKQAVAHRLVKVNSYLKFEDKGEMSVQYSWQENNRSEFDLRRGGRSEIPSLDLNLVTHSLDLEWKGRAQRGLSTSYGVNGIYQENINVPGTGIRPLIPNYSSTSGGAFFLGQYHRERWMLEAGARYDHKELKVYYFNQSNVLEEPRHTFNNFAASVGAAYMPKEGLKLRSNLGTAFRPPNISELYSQGLHHGAAAIEEGNSSLETENALKWINSIEYSKGKVRLLGSIYGQYFQNYIALNLQGIALTIRGAFPTYEYVQVNAAFAGIDGQFEYQLTERFSYLAKADFVIAKDLEHDAPLPMVPTPTLAHKITYTVPGIIGFSSIEMSAGVSTHFKAPFAPRVIHADELTELSKEELNEEKRQGAFDLLPPPDTYHLASLGIRGEVPISEKTLSIGLQINNALNTRYRDYLDRFRYFSDGLGRNFMVNILLEF